MGFSIVPNEKTETKINVLVDQQLTAQQQIKVGYYIVNVRGSSFIETIVKKDN